MFEAFLTFFKIGLFTIGGGYAMIPMIEEEVVRKRNWVSREEFLDLIAIAQTCPGVFAINISIFIGYKIKRTPCALVASLGTALPSFLIILLIAMFFYQFQDNRVINAIFQGLRPAVTALVAIPVFTLARNAHINLANCWIPLVTGVLIAFLGISPILIIIAAGVAGFVYGKYFKE
ncbi:MAG: chromate transporter [Bacteroidaceae bacterium]|nr:chromate transporter [Bacteroidaceae bacterium]